jgi:hypothetical protein
MSYSRVARRPEEGNKMTMMKFAALAAAMMLCMTAMGPATARAEEILSIEDHLALEVGSTQEWDGGDYVALNMTKGDSTAWFGVVYGNESHSNSVTIVSAYLRFLGGAEIRNEDGAMMIPATGIPVLTVYVQKLALLIEFSDDGYLEPFSGDKTGAGNGLFDFQNAGCSVDDFDVGSVEPVHKILDLNRSWERSEIVETKTIGSTEKEWTFTLSAKNLLYDKIWDNEPAENEDGSRKGRDSDGKVHDVAFQFHIGTVLDNYSVEVPWYRITWKDGGPVESSEAGTRAYNGTSLTTDFKFDHWIKDWDYQSADNLLMLETFTAFGTFIPAFVQNWLDVQFVNATAGEQIGIAELETFTGGEEDINATDTMPAESTRLTKDAIIFKDNWQKVGEMSWVSNVTVDNEDKDMYFQIHAGQNLNMEGENNDGFLHGILFLGGYVYPMGHDIFHDPSYTAHALFLDIGVNCGPLAMLGGLSALVIMISVTVAVIVVSVMVLRKTRIEH